MKLSREIKTALLVITSILIFIWGYSFLKGKDLFSSYKYYYVIYENVEGLSGSAPVTLNGLPVGKVSAINIAPTGKVVVEVQVKTDFPISKSTKLQVYEPGFIGGKQIAIIPNLQDKNLAVSGDTLKDNIRLSMLSSVGEQLAPLQSTVTSTIVNADSLLTNFNRVLDAKNRENLSIAIAELSLTLKSLNKASASLNHLIDANQKSLNGIMTNLDKTTDNFVKLSDSLVKADLAQAVKNMESTLASLDKVMADINSGKGTMGKLMKDEKLYTNLSGASKELELLLQDLRLYPTRYINVSVFGKKNKPYVGPSVENSEGDKATETTN